MLVVADDVDMQSHLEPDVTFLIVAEVRLDPRIVRQIRAKCVRCAGTNDRSCCLADNHKHMEDLYVLSDILSAEREITSSIRKRSASCSGVHSSGALSSKDFHSHIT